MAWNQLASSSCFEACGFILKVNKKSKVFVHGRDPAKSKEAYSIVAYQNFPCHVVLFLKKFSMWVTSVPFCESVSQQVWATFKPDLYYTNICYCLSEKLHSLHHTQISFHWLIHMFPCIYGKLTCLKVSLLLCITLCTYS